MSWYGFRTEQVKENGVRLGFNVWQGEKCIEVRLNEEGTLIILRELSQCDYNFNPYAYRSIFKWIHGRLTDGWQAPASSMFSKAPDDLQTKWFKKTTVKYWCRAIHNEWKDLIPRLDPAKMLLARKLFAANCVSSKSYNSGGIVVLDNYDKLIPDLRQDIIDFVPAAMLAEHNPIVFKPG